MKTIENFNAVQYMREQRDRLSQKLWAMEPNEIVEYFKQKTVFTPQKSCK
jgi:nuclear transport factor 2 (NTF2) superfamily protein